jgi:uncharacterized membrane protein YkoI
VTTSKLFGAMCLVLSLSANAATPKVSLADARKAALTKVPGTVVHEKLKHKKSGHDLYYFRVKAKDAKPGQLKKVEVDAESGKVVEVKDVKATSKPED